MGRANRGDRSFPWRTLGHSQYRRLRALRHHGAESVEGPLGSPIQAPNSTVRANPGRRRAFLACSKLYASFSNIGSLHADPKNEIPTGKPRTKPAGTVMCGYPATAAGVVHAGQFPSPSTKSFKGAGVIVGATIASTLYLAIT